MRILFILLFSKRKPFKRILTPVVSLFKMTIEIIAGTALAITVASAAPAAPQCITIIKSGSSITLSKIPVRFKNIGDTVSPCACLIAAKILTMYKNGMSKITSLRYTFATFAVGSSAPSQFTTVGVKIAITPAQMMENIIAQTKIWLAMEAASSFFDAPISCAIKTAPATVSPDPKFTTICCSGETRLIAANSFVPSCPSQ